ncbi:MAG: efflux RND transporter permease subunit [Pseudomonadota bacterium]
MNLTRLSLSNGVATFVAVLLAIIFGLISLDRLPIQLTPEVESPEITISTNWRGAAPEEIEAEIIEPQEKVLRGLPGMREMLSKAQRGRGEISIKLTVGSDLQRALVEILNRLNRVPQYPEDADEPVLNSVGGSSRPIAWFIIKTQPDNTRHIASYQNFVEEVVQTRFERVPGVALSEMRGGRAEEIRITFDAYRAANLGLQLPQLVAKIRGNEDVTAGKLHVGKRHYTLRFTGAMDAEALTSLVLEWRDGKPIVLSDVADVELLPVDRDSFVINKGEPAIAVNAHRQSGVNVLQVMDGLKEAAAELEAPLASAGLRMEQVYDETIYIDQSIGMITSNLILGILLAVGILWWFLRRFRATMMVSVSIPVSLVIAFMVLHATGHTLNVISLAGLAFAVGMVLDAAIVVLENIVRLREQGVPAAEAAYQGTMQVWGALLASTATTVAVFLPIVFMQEEAGQLFADLALTLAVAVSASLIVAVGVIPAAAKNWLQHVTMRDPHADWWDRITQTIMRLTATARRRSAWIAVLICVPLGLTIALKPDADYLPEGNRNLVFAFIMPPPGANIDFIEKDLGEVIAQRMAPYLSGEKQPQVRDYFFVAFPSGAFMGVRATDESAVDALVPVTNEAIQGFPDTLAFAKRASIFGGFGEGRTIDMNIQGRDIETLLHVAQTAYGAIQKAMPGASIRPFPGLSLSEPELRLIPDERRMAEAGWNRDMMAAVMRALGDGLVVGEHFDGEQRLDVVLRAQPWAMPDDLLSMPLATADSGVLPVGELVTLDRTAGPDQIRRLDRRRTVTLQVTPPEAMSLEAAMQILEEQVGPAITAMLPEDGAIRYSGAADKLDEALVSMGGSFMLAVVILYLLVSALFRSFKDSLLVMLVLPLGTVGGVVALQLLNLVTFQPMDILTMIGFIILMGLVVNNAILLVDLTRSGERDGVSRRDAVAQAVRMRLRPIMMTTLTTIFGMLPLVLSPGAGTELYRGLGAVIVGGMVVSTLFTLLLLPSLLRIGEQRQPSNLT